MSEWSSVALAKLTTHIKDGTHGTHARVESGVPFLSAKNVSRGRLVWDDNDDQISYRDYRAITSIFAPQQGDLLLTIVGSIGRAAVFDGSEVAFQRSVAFVRGNDSVIPEYLFQASCHEIFLRQLERRSNVTAQAGLYLGELAKVRVPLPSLPIQKKIARILQTIDRAIEQTEALIDKYQQIKAGLMHDLFTRGIGPDGQLRPPREQAPHLYQQTPIGWIPKEWEFGTCEDVCEKIIDCKNRTPPITPDGHPVIRTPNVRNGHFVDDELVYTDHESYLIWTARGAPRPGDIVITREAPVGEVCKIPVRHEHACLGQRMMLYRVDPEKIAEGFFLYVLQSKPVQNRLDLISGGSTVGHVRVGDIRTLWIFYPKHHKEQLEIAEALNTTFSKLEAEENILEKLQKQKSGLMHDLLTGKVPVTPDPEPAHA